MEKIAAKGQRVKALESRVVLYEDLVWIWQAFAELHRSRPVGFDYGPIAPSEIQTWLSLHDISDLEERIEFFELINVLDTEWLSWKQENQDSKRGKDANSVGSNKRNKS